MSNIKSDTIRGVKWNAIGRLSTSAVTFLLGIVLARILSPADYGTVGMIAIFLAIAKTFIDSGFAFALIRKKELSETDCSTVFYFNLIVSVLCYGFLFVSAPYISSFFNTPILTEVVRVSSLVLIIGAFGSVQNSLLTRDVNFRSLAIANLISHIISGAIGIAMAYNGYGLWSLVYQSLSQSFFYSFILWVFSKWRPSFLFSWQSFRELFSFGGKLLGSRLLDTFFTNITTMAIGKFYTPQDLGYYSRGHGTATLPSSFLYSIIGSVSLPILSKLQDDDTALLNVYRKYIKTCSMVIFFVMLLLAALAEPFVIAVYGEKWQPAVIFLQIFSLSYMFYHINAINVSLLLAKGRSDLNLRIEIIKKIIIAIGLVVSIPLGVLAICLASLFTSQLSLIVNTHYTRKLFNFGYLKQWKDFSPYIIYSLISCIPSFTLSYSSLNPWICLFIGGILSFIIYLSILFYTKDEALRELVGVLPIKRLAVRK